MERLIHQSYKLASGKGNLQARSLALEDMNLKHCTPQLTEHQQGRWLQNAHLSSCTLEVDFMVLILLGSGTETVTEVKEPPQFKKETDQTKFLW